MDFFEESRPLSGSEVDLRDEARASLLLSIRQQAARWKQRGKFRAIKEGEEKRLTAKFSFVLEGAVNVQSEKMTHTFDHDSSDCEFKYQQPPEEEPSTTLTDHLVVSCCVKVIPPVDPTAIPSPTSTIPATVPRPAPISPTVPAPTESVLTPLLRTLQD
jgi:hypothetical protein